MPMKFFADLLPVILFFAAYKLAGMFPESAAVLANDWLGGGFAPTLVPILLATLTTMIVTAIQIVVVKLLGKRVDKMLWLSFALITVLGGATLFFHDPLFIKWKPTILYWFIATALLGSSLLFGRNLIRSALETQLQLPDPIWARLNFAWALFFTALGLLNLYVAFSFSDEIWVNFKLFGCTALMFAFVIAQGFYLSKHMLEDGNPDAGGT
jgi:intracellular septation protein